MNSHQNHNRRPRYALDGVLLLDKPVDLSSNQALQKIKWLLQAKKAGHTGTLDPFATGLLPLCFGEATKFSADLLEADKTYEATALLGTTTTTGDTEGEVLRLTAENEFPSLSETKILDALQSLTGEIEQVPPMTSALKHAGKPLYEYARQGVEIERAARRITIHSLELLNWQQRVLSFRVCCSKGTYVRTLAESIGEALGCGAHLTALRRTQIAHLSLQQACTLEQMQHAVESNNPHQFLLPLDVLLSELARIDLGAELAARFQQGQRIPCGEFPDVLPINFHENFAEQRLVRVYFKERLLGTANLDVRKVLHPVRLIAAQPA